jgi:uncharacterized SAM-binding protein YcdF (DUF218 family)
MKKIRKIIISIITLALLFWLMSMYEVYRYPFSVKVEKVDAVIVLGAAAWGKNPSPVFRERINHAITLYKQGQCTYIIFTGGKGFPEEPGESVIARDYAIKKGVSKDRIFIENKSKNTFENLFFAREIALKYDLKSFAIVSDPYHLKRASLIAERLGMKIIPAPTPSTRFTGTGKKLNFIMKETYFLLLYRLDEIFNG